MQFRHSGCWIKISTVKEVETGKLVNHMYLLNCEAEMSASVADAN